MQIASAFGQVQDSLAWFVDNYSTLAAWRATTDRLTSFEESVAAQAQAQRPQVAHGAPGLAAHDLTLALPDGRRAAVGRCRCASRPATRCWSRARPAAASRRCSARSPASGRSRRARWRFPADTMCIPQNPYFPDGSLRDALAYPEPAGRYSDDALRQALERRPAAAAGAAAGRRGRLEPEALRRRAPAARAGARVPEAARVGAGRRGHQRAGRGGGAARSTSGCRPWSSARAAPWCRSRTGPRWTSSTPGAGSSSSSQAVAQRPTGCGRLDPAGRDAPAGDDADAGPVRAAALRRACASKACARRYSVRVFRAG